MDQRIRVYQLDRYGNRKRRFRRAAHSLRRRQRKDRPDPLSAGKEQMPHRTLEGRRKLRVIAEAFVDRRIDQRNPLCHVRCDIHRLVL